MFLLCFSYSLHTHTIHTHTYTLTSPHICIHTHTHVHTFTHTLTHTHTHTCAHLHTHREPSGPHGIKIPEVQVSKSHASIAYKKRKQCFTIKDEGSANGTFLNQKRLSEVHTNIPGASLTLQAPNLRRR